MESLKSPLLYNFLESLYQEIRDMELKNSIYVGIDDLRPNIDKYHDLITLKESNPNCLAEIKKYTAVLTELKQEPKRYVVGLERLYERYAVIFGAILADSAEEYYQMEKKELDQDIADLRTAHKFLKEEATRIIMQKQKEDNDEDDEEDNLKSLLEDSKKILDLTYDKEANLEKVHTAFLSQVSSIYTKSKAFVQSITNKGFNLAGNFTKKASQQAEQRRKRGGRY